MLGRNLPLGVMRRGRTGGGGSRVTAELLRDLHQEAWETIGLAEPRRRPALEALGWRLLERFLAAGGLDGRPLLVESPFAAELDGWTLRGVIDRVDEPSDDGGDGSEGGGAWRIIDYKSGSPLPASRLRRDLQVA